MTETSADVERCVAICRDQGLDLAHVFSLAWVDEAGLSSELRPAGFPRDALGILIGNSRALWPPVTRAWRERGPVDDPVDDHTERVVTEAASVFAERVALRFAHRRYAGRHLPVQRMAQEAGWMYLSPSHLSIHPDHGPWVALRAVVVVDRSGPQGPAPRAPDPCSTCEAPCMDALERALRSDGSVRARWRDWVAVRDACPIGRQARYSDAQIAYHYRKERRWLTEE